MQVTVNGESREMPDGASVADLVAQFDLTPERVAVEVNERLVRRATYRETALREGDRVEIVTLVGGG
ncbi:MAG: sulfur carrier protein ThiS [Phycisphaerae bacterium]|jgi:thiamine biosynthesis protein ThiS|nr:sulfur carrier protein ThiS [Phycisphaerae bacterium]